LNKDGSGYAILHNFSSAGQSESMPAGGMAEGPDGALYGAVSSGGTNLLSGGVFRVQKDGTGYIVLRLFGSGTDGATPLAGLIVGSDGMLYGTTYSGGSNGHGTVFAINTNASFYSLLHSFDDVAGEGFNPQAMLFEGTDGALYGGTWNSPGVVPAGGAFKLSKDGATSLVLHGFGTIPNDGTRLKAAMTQGADGALYGATFSGGSNNVGAVFRVNSDSTGYQFLHSFSNTGADGQNPSGGMVRGWDGYLYGTTGAGGSNGVGTIFRINNDGSDYSVIHHFGIVPGDGSDPVSLIVASDGAFYGAAQSGGAWSFGAVFRLLPLQTPDLVAAVAVSNTVQLTLTGIAGYQYSVLHSTNLTNWDTLATVLMPASGTWTNWDSTLPTGSAFYRAAWIP
jgi:uncharacterized repeat protein (TIGR03803 family)